MHTQKTTSLDFLLIFFLSYSFYTIQVLSQLLFKYYSKQATPIICLFFLLSPIVVFFVCKKINKEKGKKENNNKLISILTSLYLVITTIVALVYVINIVLIYYYQQTSIILLLLFLMFPILYTIIKGENNFFSLASILLILFIFFKYAYLNNSSSIDFYVFYDIFKMDRTSFVPLLLISISILLEPIILLTNHQYSMGKINVKLTVIFSILLSLIGTLTILRQTWEFGSLLSTIRFPYLESAKNIMAGKFFENIDYYYLLSISASVYIRLGYTVISIKQSFRLNKITSIAVLFLILILIYILYSSLQLAEFITHKGLIVASCSLLLMLFILPFIKKRRYGESD